MQSNSINEALKPTLEWIAEDRKTSQRQWHCCLGLIGSFLAGLILTAGLVTAGALTHEVGFTISGLLVVGASVGCLGGTIYVRKDLDQTALEIQKKKEPPDLLQANLGAYGDQLYAGLKRYLGDRKLSFSEVAVVRIALRGHDIDQTYGGVWQAVAQLSPKKRDRFELD